MKALAVILILSVLASAALVAFLFLTFLVSMWIEEKWQSFRSSARMKGSA